MVSHKINPVGFLGLLIHELKEIIQIEQGTRFYNPTNSNYEFHYNHAQHQDMTCRLAGLLDNFLK